MRFITTWSLFTVVCKMVMDQAISSAGDFGSFFFF